MNESTNKINSWDDLMDFIDQRQKAGDKVVGFYPGRLTDEEANAVRARAAAEVTSQRRAVVVGLESEPRST